MDFEHTIDYILRGICNFSCRIGSRAEHWIRIHCVEG
jgi:hypothetical protein